MFDHPKRNYTYGEPYVGWKTGKESEDYENDMKWNSGVIEFRTTDDHGICSPPLWEKQSGAAPSPAIESDDALNLSPTSRREVVNRGRLELMEMVKAMPESSYELSLKDLVDNFKEPEQNSHVQESAKKNKAKKKMSNINEKHKGVFLKMVELPFGGGGASKKKKVKNPYARVAEDGGFEEKEWWNKIRRWSVSDHNASGTTRSQSTRDKNGCFSGFHLRKSKSAKSI